MPTVAQRNANVVARAEPLVQGERSGEGHGGGALGVGLAGQIRQYSILHLHRRCTQ